MNTSESIIWPAAEEVKRGAEDARKGPVGLSLTATPRVFFPRVGLWPLK